MTVVGAVVLPASTFAAFTDGANAIDVLGQYEDPTASPLVPVYTKSGANDSPNKVGLNGPRGIVLDVVGHRLFVADGGNQRVLVFGLNADNTFTDHIPDNVLGQSTYYTAAYATTQNGMYSPYGLVYDSTNSRLFVAELSNQRVTVHSVISITNGQNAANVLGQPDFTSAVSATTQNGMYGPRGLAYDSTNSLLFVAEGNNNRVIVQNIANIVDGQNAANVLGQPNFTRNTNAITQNGMYNPFGLVYDTAGNRLFVAEGASNRVTVFAIATITDGQNATNVLGQPNFTRSTSATTQNGLKSPVSLAYDAASARLFVGEAGTGNNRVIVQSVATITDGQNAANVLGQPNFTSAATATTQNGMYEPSGMAYDSVGSRLFITDLSNHRVIVQSVAAITDGQNAMDLLGQFQDHTSPVTPVYTKSGSHDSPNNIGFTAGSSTEPISIIDAYSHRFFLMDADNNRVLVYNLDADNHFPDKIADAVLGQPDFYSNSSATTQNGMYSPRGLAYDVVGSRLFVSDLGNYRVIVQNVSTITDGQNAANVLGQPNFASKIAAGTTQNGMGGPRALAYDAVGSRLFVSDGGARVIVHNVATITDGQNAANVLGQPNFTSAISATTQNGVSGAYGLAYDSTHSRLFIGESGNNRITVQDVSSIVDGQNAVDVLGQLDSSLTTPSYTKGGPNNGPGTVGFSSPYGIALDTVGHRLFVVDGSNNRILVFGLTIDNVLIDHTADNVLGQSDFFSKNSQTSQNGLNSPMGLVYDDITSRLFIGDRSNNRVIVQHVASIVNGQNASNVLGQPNFNRSTTGNAQNSLSSPYSLAYDSIISRLFIADSGNNRIIVQNIDTITDGQNAANVLGQPNFYRTNSGITQNTMNTPYGLAYDSVISRLFIAEYSNNRVTVQNVATITNGQNAANVLGQPNFTRNTFGRTQNGLFSPFGGLAYDPTNSRLFILDTSNYRVIVQNVATITDGQNAANVLGQPNFTSWGAAMTQNGISSARGLAYDTASSRLFIADTSNNRIIIQDVSSITDGQNAVDALGQTEGSVDSAPSTFTKSGINNGPSRYGLYSIRSSLALDTTTHRLFVGDSGNNRILIYALNDDNTIARHYADNVLGQTNFLSNSSGGTQAKISTSSVLGLGYDPSNERLFVADNSNRILIFDVSSSGSSDSTSPTILSATSSTPSGSYVVGDVISITVTFSETVTSTGDVTVTLDTGGTCTFTVASATTGTCNYTVAAGETSSDLTVTSVTGTVKDAALNPMVTPATPATNLAAGNDIVIDTTVTTPASSSSSSSVPQQSGGSRGSSIARRISQAAPVTQHPAAVASSPASAGIQILLGIRERLLKRIADRIQITSSPSAISILQGIQTRLMWRIDLRIRQLNR